MGERRATFFLAALGAAALAAAGCSEQISGTVETVHRVVDGDTVILKTGEQVRIAGCDAPAKGKPGWNQGRNELQKLIGGRKVGVERQGKDRQGRTLARIYMYDGRDVSGIMVAKGLAKPWPDEPAPEAAPAPEPTIEPAGRE